MIFFRSASVTERFGTVTAALSLATVAGSFTPTWSWFATGEDAVNNSEDSDANRATLLGNSEQLLALISSNSEVRVHSSSCVGHRRAGSVTGRWGVGVKTSRFFHSTRAVTAFAAWGFEAPHLMFVSDGPLQEAVRGSGGEQGGRAGVGRIHHDRGHNSWQAETVIVESPPDLARTTAYVPPWRQGGENPSTVDPFLLPRLVHRVAELLLKMHECWFDMVDWFLVVDDDTFVRMGRLRDYVASLKLDPEVPYLIGSPVNSQPFTRDVHWRRFGPSLHCGGGTGMLLSRGFLGRFVAEIPGCLEGEPRTTLHWYWDEVELLGRCVVERLRLNCTGFDELQPTRAPTLAKPSAEEPWEEPFLWATRNEDLELLPSFVDEFKGGNWSALRTLTMHPVVADQQLWLAGQFNSGGVMKSSSDAMPLGRSFDPDGTEGRSDSVSVASPDEHWKKQSGVSNAVGFATSNGDISADADASQVELTPVRPPHVEERIRASRCIGRRASSLIGSVGIGVKTTRHYHGTRAAASFAAWGFEAPFLMFVSDAPLSEADVGPLLMVRASFAQEAVATTITTKEKQQMREGGSWQAEVVVVESTLEAQRERAYVPPWRQISGTRRSGPVDDEGEVDPFSLPRLVRRVAELLIRVHQCWSDEVNWLLIVDDDTFVRVGPLQEYVSGLGLDPSGLHLLGVPVDSEPFTWKSHWRRFGASLHCGGGTGVLLSRGLVARLAAELHQCVSAEPRTLLSWYWDEVELLGRCVYELLRLNCTHVDPEANSMSILEPLFFNIESDGNQDDEWGFLHTYVHRFKESNWSALRTLTFHPVTAERQQWLSGQFRQTTVPLGRGVRRRRRQGAQASTVLVGRNRGGRHRHRTNKEL